MSEILKKTKQPSKQSKPKFRSKELKPAKKEMEEEMQDGALIEDQKMINTLVPVNDEAIVIDDPGWESDLDIDG